MPNSPECDGSFLAASATTCITGSSKHLLARFKSLLCGMQAGAKGHGCEHARVESAAQRPPRASRAWARAIDILRTDVVRTMKLLGCGSIKDLDGSYVDIPAEWLARLPR